MSDDFSWAPFGGSDSEPPPPLAPQEGTPPPLAAQPVDEAPAEPLAPLPELEPLPDAADATPRAMPDVTDIAWPTAMPSATPVPETPEPVAALPPMEPPAPDRPMYTASTTASSQQIGLDDVQRYAAQAAQVVGQQLNQQLGQQIGQLSGPGSGLATTSLVWALVGLLVCPILVPSIVAIVYGNRARAAGGMTRRGSWGRALGWFGLIGWGLFWALAALGGILSAT